MLNKLELHNFKSHHDTQLNFDNSRLQAIVGQNSSGKTSVLQAVHYLGQLSALNFGYLDEYKQKMPELMEITGENCATIGCNSTFISRSGIEKIKGQENWKLSCQLHIANRKISQQNIIWNLNGREIKDTNIGSTMMYGGVYEPEDLKFIVYLKLVVTNLVKASYSEEITPEIQFDGSGLAPTLDYLRSEAPDRFQSIQEMLEQIVPGVKKVGIRRAKVKIDRRRSIEVDVLAQITTKLNFDPCEEAHRLRDDLGEDRNPKLVVRKLTGGDIIREQQCWEETDLEILRVRGANTGLREYLKEVEQRLISILDRADL